MDIPLALPVVDEDMREEVDRVLREEFYLGGDSVEAFERDFADYVGTEHAVAVSSGTAAIHLALRAHGIGEGDTVITTPATFIATANAIVRTGATPKFVDISMDTYTIDVDAVERAIEDSDVDAILPVHLYGYPADMSRLQDVAGDIPIIGDACQAHGAKIDGEDVGALGQAACFSFYPSKNMTVAGDGGMVTTDDDDVASRVRSLRDVGRADEGKYDHQRIGYTDRLGTINAAIGRQQLRRLDEWNARRSEISSRYRDAWADIEELVLPPDGSSTIDPAWYLYVVRCDNRDDLAAHLEARGVETGIHYDPPVHLQPPYRERGHESETFLDTERWAKEVLSLPVHPHLSDEEVEHVITSVEEYFA